MKIKLISASVVGLLGLAAASTAFAYDGQINFDGKLTGSTCSVVAGDTNKTVTLPTISTNTLATKGATAGSTTFTIGVENCSAGINTVAAHFETDNLDADNLAAKNTAPAGTGASAPATFVDVQLVDRDGTTALNLGQTGTGVAPTYTGTTGAATLTYAARYIATGAATAGVVQSYVRFTLAYN